MQGPNLIDHVALDRPQDVANLHLRQPQPPAPCEPSHFPGDQAQDDCGAPRHSWLQERTAHTGWMGAPGRRRLSRRNPTTWRHPPPSAASLPPPVRGPRVLTITWQTRGRLCSHARSSTTRLFRLIPRAAPIKPCCACGHEMHCGRKRAGACCSGKDRHCAVRPQWAEWRGPGGPQCRALVQAQAAAARGCRSPAGDEARRGRGKARCPPARPPARGSFVRVRRSSPLVQKTENSRIPGALNRQKVGQPAPAGLSRTGADPSLLPWTSDAPAGCCEGARQLPLAATATPGSPPLCP